MSTMLYRSSQVLARQSLRVLRQQARLASTSASAPTYTLRRTVAATLALVSGTVFAVYYFDSRSALHRYLVTPLLRYTLDPETSHKVAVKVLRSGFAPKDTGEDDERLSTEVSFSFVHSGQFINSIQIWGEKLSNPVGLAAGFDKNGEAIDGMRQHTDHCLSKTYISRQASLTLGLAGLKLGASPQSRRSVWFTFDCPLLIPC